MQPTTENEKVPVGLISELLSDERAHLIHCQLTQHPLNEVSLWQKKKMTGNS